MFKTLVEPKIFVKCIDFKLFQFGEKLPTFFYQPLQLTFVSSANFATELCVCVCVCVSVCVYFCVCMCISQTLLYKQNLFKRIKQVSALIIRILIQTYTSIQLK